MQSTQPPLWARDHTLFGVCEGLGEDFGFNPLFLRVPLAVFLLVNPVAVFAAYAGGAVLVAFTRFVVPNPRQAAVTGQPAVEPPAGQAGDNDDPALAIAA
jgi:phage shock protein PspC (stress-responsive transcriptional regulator)